MFYWPITCIPFKATLKCASFQIFHTLHQESLRKSEFGALLTCLLFTLQEKMAARNSRKRNVPARLREGKQLRINRVYESKNWSTNDHACISLKFGVFKSWYQYINDCDPKSCKPSYNYSTCTLLVYNTCHTIEFTLEDSVILLRL